VLLNEFLGLSFYAVNQGGDQRTYLQISKKDLKKTFDIIDRAKQGRVRLEDIKQLSQMLDSDDTMLEEDEASKLEGEELKRRQELDDLYEALKDRLEKRNTTLEALIYEQLKYMPNQFANTKGVQQLFEKLGIVLSKNEAERVLQDVRAANHGRFECSFKEFIDFMTRKRVNVAFLDKGFVDPLIASCCHLLNKAVQGLDLTLEKLFEIFDKERDGRMSKDVFIKCMQGLELGISIEDLVEFFNYIDDKNENVITKLQFADAVTFVINKIGGGSKLE
jgi:Ca2+-binding EF-hand superfamily protein